MSYYFDRRAAGRPLVLIHSINAAGCSYEMRPMFEHYRSQRPVYALDLPGFGFSERSNREYSPELYAQAMGEFLRSEVGEPADVVALSLGCEFAARSALAYPERFRSLALISPSGFTDETDLGSSQRARKAGSSDRLYRLSSFPLWARAFYDLIVTRPSIHYFLSLSFEGPVDRGLEEYGYLTSHQPGAHHAPLYFVSGALFTPSVRQQVYERLSLPVLVLYDRDAFVRFDTLPQTLERCQNWRAARIPATRGLPQFEKMGEIATAVDAFWRETANG